jgi:hypothetical protein
MAFVLGCVVALADAAAAVASRTRHGRADARGAGSSGLTAAGRATYGRFPTHHVHRPHYFFSFYRPYPYSFWPWYIDPSPYGYPDPWAPYCWLAGVPSPEGLPATVETDIRPKRAVVVLDGVEVGEARDYNGMWDRLHVEPGPHELEFRAPGYQTLRLQMTIRPGRGYLVQHELRPGEGLDPRSTRVAEAQLDVAPQPRAREGRLRLRVLPEDAAIYLDGAFLGRAGELAALHGALAVDEGTHVLEILRPGYEPRSLELRVEGRQPVDVQVELEPSR